MKKPWLRKVKLPNLQKRSRVWRFPGAQWLGLCASTAGSLGSIPVRDLRSHILHNVVPKLNKLLKGAESWQNPDLLKSRVRPVSPDEDPREGITASPDQAGRKAEDGEERKGTPEGVTRV